MVQRCAKPISLLKDQKGARMVRVGMEWFLKQTGPARTAHLESGGFCRSRPGIEHPDIMFHFLPSQVIDHGRKAAEIEAFQVRGSKRCQKQKKKQLVFFRSRRRSSTK